jgi:hypothetical protein
VDINDIRAAVKRLMLAADYASRDDKAVVANAIAELEDARAVAAAAEALVADVDGDPTDDGGDCYACGEHSSGAHDPGCSWVALRAALATLRGDGR